MNLYYKLSILMGIVVVTSNYLVQFPIQKFGLEDIISIRIAVGSGTAFFIAQNLDVQVFDRLRKKSWYVAPLTSSIIGSISDTFLFFSIAFYATGIPWVTLALGDLLVKLFITLLMLIPFRLLLKNIKDYTENSVSRI